MSNYVNIINQTMCS